MCLLPQTGFVTPEQTERIARAAFPKGSLCLRIADELGRIFLDEQFAELFPRRGQPAEAPARLAFVTLLQYAENLSDRQAADAVRGRIDWKYALGLELSDPGFDSTVLSEFRTRLVQGSAEQILLATLLQMCQAKKLLMARGRQRTDSTHVLGAIRAMNRLECSGEVVRHTLNVLAVVAPDWLRGHSQPEWIGRYGPRVEDYRLPKSETLRQAHARQIGLDGSISMHRTRLVGCGNCRPWKHCGASGYSNIIERKRRCVGGAEKTACRPPPGSSVRPMIRRRTTPRNARPPGWDTKCI